MQMCRCADAVQICRCADVQRCRGAAVQKCRGGVEVQVQRWFKGGAKVMQREVQRRCRGRGAEVPRF